MYCMWDEKMKKKLLVYVNSMNALGGIERVIDNLTRALADYYDITILVKDEPVSAYVLDARINIDTINAKLTMNMNSRIQRILSVPVNIIKSKRMLKKWLNAHESIDYVYTAFPTNGIEMYFAEKNLRKRIVAAEHASYYAYNSVYKKMKEWLYPRLNAISVPTTMDTEIYRKLGYKASYIPHLSTYIAQENPNPNSKVAINVGRLTSDKQQILLLEMWRAVNEKIPNHGWKLQIIGSGEEDNRLREFIAEYNITNVEMIPHTSRIEDYYKNAGLFLFTSKMEGFGMVLLEAMSFGIPCISFDCPSGPRDMIKDGENGYLVPCYDKEKYVERICEYMNDDSHDRLSMQKKAIDFVVSWDNKRIIESWNDMFRRLGKEE